MTDTVYNASDYFSASSTTPSPASTAPPEVAPGVISAEDLKPIQSRIEQDLGRPLTTAEQSTLAAQAKTGKFNFQAAQPTSHNANDYFTSPTPAAPQHNVSDYVGTSIPTADPNDNGMMGFKVGAMGAAQGVAQFGQNTWNAVKNAGSAIGSQLQARWQGLPSPDFHYEVQPGPNGGTRVAVMNDDPDTYQVKQKQAAAAFEATMPGKFGWLPQSAQLILQQSMPANFLKGLVNSNGADPIINQWNASRAIMQQRIVEHPDQFPPEAVQAATAAIAATKAKVEPSYFQTMQNFIQAAKEDPGRFGLGMARGLVTDPEFAMIPGGVGLRPLESLSADAAQLPSMAKRIDSAVDAAAAGAAMNTGAQAAQSFANNTPQKLTELLSAATQGAGFGGVLGAILGHGAKAQNATIDPSLGTADPNLRLRAAYDVATENAIAHPTSVDATVLPRINKMLGIPDDMSDADRQTAINARRQQSIDAFSSDQDKANYLKVLADERIQQTVEQNKPHVLFNNTTGQWELKSNPALADGAPKAQGAVAPEDVSLQTLARGPAEAQVAQALTTQDPSQKGYVDPDLVKKIALYTGGGLLAATAGAKMFPQDPAKGALGAVLLAGLGAFAHGMGVGSLDRLGPSDQMGAIRLKGEGEIHPWLTEGVAGTSPEMLAQNPNDPTIHTATQKYRMVQQYLNKHAGVSTDPLKDVRLPNGDRWEDLMDKAMYEPEHLKGSAKREFQNPWVTRNDNYNNPNAYLAQPAGEALDKITDYLNHVEDYLRTVPESKLPQYDLVRAVKETQAWDAANAKKMAQARAKSMEGMPVYKDYGDGMKWVQLTRSEDFPQESDVMGHSVRGYAATKYIDKNGDPISNDFFFNQNGKLKFTQAELDRQGYKVNPDWNEASGLSGHPFYGVGTGGWEAIKNGSAKVYSLRDGQGNSHVTVEVENIEGKHNIPNGRHPEMEPDSGPVITQIKGKQNAKPADKYLPYVQDFVRGGKWGDVGDLRNADLVDTSVYKGDLYNKYKQQMHPDAKYLTFKEDAAISAEAAKEYYSEKMHNRTIGGDQSGKADLDLLKKLGLGAAGIAAAGTIGANLSPNDKLKGALAGVGTLAATMLAGHLTAGSGDGMHGLFDQIGGYKPRLRFDDTDGNWKLNDGPSSIKNSTMQEQRVAHGLEPLPKDTTPLPPENVNTARAAIASNPTLPKQVVDRILNGDRKISVADDAVLQVHNQALDHELMKQAAVIADPKASATDRATAQELYNNAVYESHRLTQASQITGRVWSDIGQLRDQNLAQDLSISNMIAHATTLKREALGDEHATLSSQELKDLQSRATDLAKAEEVLREHTAKSDVPTPQEVLKQHITQAPQSLAPTAKPHFLVRMKAIADEARTDLEKSKGVPSNRGQSGAVSLNDIWNYVKLGAYHIVQGTHDLGQWMAKMNKDLGAKFSALGQKPASHIYQLAQTFQAQLRQGVRMSPAQLKQYNNVMQGLQRAVGQARIAAFQAKNAIATQHSSLGAKVWKNFLGFRLFALFTNPEIIEKLGTSSVARVGLTPLELGIEQLNKLIPGLKSAIYNKADYSNSAIGPTAYLKAEAAALSPSTLGKGLQDIVGKFLGHPQILQDMAYILGVHPEFADPKSPHFIPGLDGLQKTLTGSTAPTATDHLLQMPGRIHDILKTPAERGEYERAQVRFATTEGAAAKAAGLTPAQVQAHLSDPMVQGMLSLKSFVKSQEAKFAQDSQAAVLLNKWIQDLKGYNKVLGGAAEFVTPVKKTAFNLATEITHYAPLVGYVKAGMKYYAEHGQGLTPEGADYIAKMLRKQPVGIALGMATVAFAKQFGGIHHEGNKKKESEDIPYGAARVPKNSPFMAGQNINKAFLHYPLFQMMSILADGVNGYASAKAGQSAYGRAASWMAVDTVKQLPGEFTLEDASKVTSNPNTLSRFAGQQVSSLIPAFISKPAEWADSQKRYPRDFLDQIKEKLPGLREQVPTSPQPTHFVEHLQEHWHPKGEKE